VHRVIQVGGRYVDVSASLERTLGQDEPETAAVSLQAADVEVHLLRQPEAMTADLNQIAGLNERLDVTCEGFALIARNLEELQEFFDSSWMMHAIAHHREDVV
jgi:hypothetical protein